MTFESERHLHRLSRVIFLHVNLETHTHTHTYTDVKSIQAIQLETTCC